MNGRVGRWTTASSMSRGLDVGGRKTIGRARRATATAAVAWVAGFAGVAVPVAGHVAAAQLPPAVPSALVVGRGMAASVRGFGAVAVNPAGLAMPGGPRHSVSVAPFLMENGIGPLGLGDLARAGGKLLASDTKDEWLSKIAADKGQSGPLSASVTWTALSVAGFGFQLSTQMASSMDLAPELVELALYGNAGRTGSPGDLDARPSTGDAWAVSTAALAYAVSFDVGDATAAFGATLKYSRGHLAAMLDGRSATASSSPLAVSVNSPIIYAGPNVGGNAGSGAGVDLGFQYASGRFAGGVTVQNVFNGFSWSEAESKYRPVVADLRGGEFDTDLAVATVSQAPADLRSRWEEMTFEPRLAAALVYEATPAFRVSADVASHFGNGMRPGPKFSAGAGGEWRATPRVSLEFGGGAASGGFEFGGGGVVSLGSVDVSLAGGWRRHETGGALLFATGLSYSAR